MKTALFLLANRAEARALTPMLRGLEAVGASLALAAPAGAQASIEALGLSVDVALTDPSSAEALGASLERLCRDLAPGLVLVSATSALGSAPALATARAGIPLLPVTSGQPTGLALEDFVAAARREIEEIQPEEARRILETRDREGWHFVDVREPDEYVAGHIPGARSSPRGFLEVRADLSHYKRESWFEDRGRPMILYCGGGHRSALATSTLAQMGFTRLLSLAEGFSGWTERGYPVAIPDRSD